jgi:hypothetical protein
VRKIAGVDGCTWIPQVHEVQTVAKPSRVVPQKTGDSICRHIYDRGYRGNCEWADVCETGIAVGAVAVAVAAIGAETLTRTIV